MLTFRFAQWIVVMLLASRAVSPTPGIAQELPTLQRQVTELTGAGRYSEALATSQRALSLAERQFGPEHPAVAAWVNHIAYLNDMQGRYRDAERLYTKALAMREKALGPYHPDVAATLNNLAGSYQEQGRYAEAEPLFRRALCAVAQSAGAPQTAVHLGNRATEKTVKELSASGSLANARIVHFATHGLLASEAGMVHARAEPEHYWSPTGPWIRTRQSLS
jgi:tetratricopeptide (TPR) repeat protein